MTIYAIGDVQGCFDALKNLLKEIHFSEDKDQLWFTGDIVNRGPDSLKVLEFVKSLKDNAITVLGNHDLHMLAVLTGLEKQRRKDTLDDIIHSPRKHQIIDWVRQLPLLHLNPDSNFVMVHAGLYPDWNIAEASSYAQEVERVLQGDNFTDFFRNMYGNQPSKWEPGLSSWDRLRFITNCFTRMRLLDKDLNLDLHFKGSPEKAPRHLKPWYMYGEDKRNNHTILFGHWSTLGYQSRDNVYALDTGCLWGGKLTALALTEDPYHVSIPCHQTLEP